MYLKNIRIFNQIFKAKKILFSNNVAMMIMKAFYPEFPKLVGRVILGSIQFYLPGTRLLYTTEC